MNIFTVADMFCGAGGVTEGIEKSGIAKVKWAINHDPLAIQTHETNHKDVVHYLDDIVKHDVSNLPKIDVLWASPDCTHFSCAAGGRSRDADSRMLARQLLRYAPACDPDYIIIENVKEFMSWGPLDENGRPRSKDKGRYYLEWIRGMKKIGYINYERRLLNAADYGARTNRTRYFGIFSKKGFPIVFPTPTHTKEPNDFIQKKWLPVRPCLDLHDHGKSIFEREKPLVERTLKRIAYGITKEVLNDPEFKNFIQFMIKYYGNGSNAKSIDDPIDTITTKDRFAFVNLETAPFIHKNYGGMQTSNVDDPLYTIMTGNIHSLVTPQFIQHYYNSANKNQYIQKHFTGKHQSSSLENPLHTIMTNHKHSLVTLKHWLSEYMHNRVGKARSIDDPINTILTKEQIQIISAQSGTSLSEDGKKRKRQFFLKYFGQSLTSSIDDPIGALTGSQQYALCTVDFLDWLITDIKMRFLYPHELKKAQGFRDDYYLAGPKVKQIKFIGNSVPPDLPEAIISALHRARYPEAYDEREIA